MRLGGGKGRVGEREEDFIADLARLLDAFLFYFCICQRK